MRPCGHDRVIAALRNPEPLAEMSLAEWDVLVRQARSADLLARIGGLLDERGMLEQVPAAPRAHLTSAIHLASAQQDEVRREVAHIMDALHALAVPVVLLKGSAYVLAALPAALGRTFSDVDILVPRPRLGEVEAALMLAGWATTHHDAYDQRYYRQWMHELPPLQHTRRGTVLDVHHAILPDTARLRPDSRRLLAAAHRVPGANGVYVLAPTDVVLHSMTHLFHNEELSHGLRDLSDLDRLLRHFGAAPGFWDALVPRAAELDLRRPLYYGLLCTGSILETPIPQAVWDDARRAAPAGLLRPLMAQLWRWALRSPHGSAAERLTGASRAALYLRAHWLRMPPALLLRHLLVKALRRDGA